MSQCSFDGRWLVCVVASVAMLPELAAPKVALAEEMQYPLSAVAAADGTIYVADRNLPGIWKVADGKAEVYHQASRKFRTPLNAIRCLALDSEGKLLAGDSATREVYRFDAPDKPVPLTGGYIGIPMSIAVQGDGTILVADLESHRIYKVPSGGGEPQEVAQVVAPRGLALSSDGQIIVLSTSSKKGQLLKVAADGSVSAIVADQPFQFPHNVAVLPDGNIYVTDGYGKCVWKVVDGKPEQLVSGDPLKNPVGLAAAGEGLLVVDPHAKAVFRLAAEGQLETVVQAANP